MTPKMAPNEPCLPGIHTRVQSFPLECGLDLVNAIQVVGMSILRLDDKKNVASA